MSRVSDIVGCGDADVGGIDVAGVAGGIVQNAIVDVTSTEALR